VGYPRRWSHRESGGTDQVHQCSRRQNLLVTGQYLWSLQLSVFVTDCNVLLCVPVSDNYRSTQECGRPVLFNEPLKPKARWIGKWWDICEELIQCEPAIAQDLNPASHDLNPSALLLGYPAIVPCSGQREIRWNGDLPITFYI